MTVELQGLAPMTWTHGEGQYHWESDVLALTSDAGVDWTNDAAGGTPSHTSTSLSFELDGPFQLSARVSVDAPRTTFDAAVLTLWVNEDCWAKLCFEYSPQGEEMVVSVVTDRFSDDANGPVILDGSVWLRVSSLPEGAYAFHYSKDGTAWSFVRQFRLNTSTRPRIGFMSQAPMGPPATSRFFDISLVREQLADVRDGS
jgi:regulation of enolase protein 1 (concanavalin A-like superfamily)